MRRSIWKPIAVATLLCGTLDIAFAVLLTLLRGKEPAAMLRFVASGPFPAATGWGAFGSVLGLIVHYGLMAMIVAAFVLAARSRNREHLVDMPVRAGRLMASSPTRS